MGQARKPSNSPANVTIAQKLFALHNEVRVKNGLKPLTENPFLLIAAARHSQDMVVRQYLDHITPEGWGPGYRAEQAGFQHPYVGENIVMRSNYWYESPDQVAESLFESWMNSEGHKRNILYQDYTEVGIGVYITSSTVYAIADFA